MYDIPILLLTYKRLHSTQLIIKLLQQIRPTKLYVVSDGPSTLEDIPQVTKVRECVVSGVNWPCEFVREFKETHLGCDRLMVEALDMFFGSEKLGIVLEDDVIPHTNFFRFHKEMLERYEGSENVWFVGSFHIPSVRYERVESDHALVPYTILWGWSTWCTKWQTFRKTPYFVNSYIPPRLSLPIKTQTFWQGKLNQVKAGGECTYDVKFVLHILCGGGSAVVPHHPLIWYVGCDEYATHTKRVVQSFAHIARKLEECTHVQIAPLTDGRVQVSG